MLPQQKRRDLDPMLRPLVVVAAALRRPHQERAAGDRDQLQDDAIPQLLDELLRPALFPAMIWPWRLTVSVSNAISWYVMAPFSLDCR